MENEFEASENNGGEITWNINPGSLITVQDMTRPNPGGETLRNSENIFWRMLESSPNGVIIADAGARIRFVNVQAEQMFGYCRQELLGESVEELLPGGTREDHVKLRSEHMMHSSSRPMGTGPDTIGRRKDGSQFPVDITLSPLETDDGVLVISTVCDITERRKLENALQLSKQELELKARELNRVRVDLDRFVEIASHDLQEPLRIISGFSQILQEKYRDQLKPEANECIEFLVDGANRMRDRIDGLLAFSRVETRGRPLELVDCEEIMGRAISNIQAAIADSGATITHEPLPEVMADATQLIQVFQNLMTNAVKFRNTSPPVVHISAAHVGGEYIFSFKDNGIGVAAKFRERIFEIFQRLHTREEYPGTGMGLAICHRILSRHGGRIWVESEPGQGSTFCFSLPAMERISA